MKFLPVVQTGRVFKDDDDMKIWFSNDSNFIPVRIQLDMILGSAKADLIEYSGIMHELNIVK